MIIGPPKCCVKDLAIIPCTITDINSIDECIPFTEDGMYPIFASPMNCVSNEKNYDVWIKNKIQAILPRTVSYNIRLDYMLQGKWTALSEQEFEFLFTEEDSCKQYLKKSIFRICIDTMNGHKKFLYDNVNTAKKYAKKYGYTIVIMLGNIANPETYRWICENSDVDYIRVNIGTGKSCCTSVQSGVHYPAASLISDCAKIREEFLEDIDEYHQYPKCLPKIVSDGGMQVFSDIIIALALGADYVMIGSLLAACDESASETVEMNNEKMKIFYGITTNKVQALIQQATTVQSTDKEELMTEGVTRYLDCSGPIARWLSKFESALKIAMSYTGCRTIKEFTSGNVQLIIKSPQTIKLLDE